VPEDSQLILLHSSMSRPIFTVEYQKVVQCISHSGDNISARLDAARPGAGRGV
jgi:hypothetical protein